MFLDKYNMLSKVLSVIKHVEMILRLLGSPREGRG